ncbi:MAG: anti-sigma F factor [Clostridia bacterium]|nr:anti-sigma F factor [Clostridia bacterium]
MELINEMNLTFSSKSMNENFARAAVSAFVLPLDPTITELADIKTAVSEAVTNSIIHGYEYGEGQITVNAKIFDTGKIIIKIRDKGKGIENINQAMEPLFSTVGGERAGLGFAVMQSFMDKLKVTSKVNCGTTVTMEKYIIRRNKSVGND